MQETVLIVWDEVPMQHRYCIEAVDATLRDLLHRDVSFGGITVVFGGDFRQILPVVPRGSREQIVNACLQRSVLWGSIIVLRLFENMRLLPGSEEFATWLLKVGGGEDLPDDCSIELPAHMRCATLEDLSNTIYPDLPQPGHSDQYFLERSILSCRNDDVDDLNASLLNRFPGEHTVYHSADSVVDANGDDPYPVEFLNSIKAGMCIYNFFTLFVLIPL